MTIGSRCTTFPLTARISRRMVLTTGGGPAVRIRIRGKPRPVTVYGMKTSGDDGLLEAAVSGILDDADI